MGDEAEPLGEEGCPDCGLPLGHRPVGGRMCPTYAEARLAELAEEHDGLRDTLDQRTRERDEARAEVRRWIDRCKQERGRVDHFHAWVRELERCQCRRSAGTELRKGSGVVVCVSCGRIAPAVGTRDTGGGDE